MAAFLSIDYRKAAFLCLRSKRTSAGGQALHTKAPRLSEPYFAFSRTLRERPVVRSSWPWCTEGAHRSLNSPRVDDLTLAVRAFVRSLTGDEREDQRAARGDATRNGGVDR